jgi:hypothetical protein
MKKFAILALAALLVVAFTVPASALENEFGGYWRTRFFTSKYFGGLDKNDPGGSDDTFEQVDTRTRLYYTAKINDNLKFVNKFEMDAAWGVGDSRNIDNRGAKASDPAISYGANRPYGSSYGNVGADGIAVEVKNSYADFNLGPVNLTVGVQPYELFRGFYISDDAAGIIARYKVLDNFVLAGSWLKNYENGSGGDTENQDIDAYTLSGAFWFSENISIKPSVSWAYSSQTNPAVAHSYLAFALGAGYPYATGNNGVTPTDGLAVTDSGEASIFTYGVDFDMTYDNWGLWATAIGQTGSIDDITVTEFDAGGAPIGSLSDDLDVKGYLLAVGGNVVAGPADIHGQFFYASGDDDPLDSDIDTFFNPTGSYYWAEIMGYGFFDDSVSANSPADKIRNIMAANIGATFKPMDKLSITADLWYAELNEKESAFDNANGEDELGTELDVVISYQLVEGLNLDLVGAYLWAGDATVAAGDKNEENPYEFGAQLSLSF